MGLTQDEARELFQRFLCNRLGNKLVFQHAEALDITRLEQDPTGLEISLQNNARFHLARKLEYRPAALTAIVVRLELDLVVGEYLPKPIACRAFAAYPDLLVAGDAEIQRDLLVYLLC